MSVHPPPLLATEGKDEAYSRVTVNGWEANRNVGVMRIAITITIFFSFFLSFSQEMVFGVGHRDFAWGSRLAPFPSSPSSPSSPSRMGGSMIAASIAGALLSRQLALYALGGARVRLSPTPPPPPPPPPLASNRDKRQLGYHAGKERNKQNRASETEVDPGLLTLSLSSLASGQTTATTATGNSNRQQQQQQQQQQNCCSPNRRVPGAGLRFEPPSSPRPPPPSPLPCPPTLLQNLIHVQAYGCPWRHRCSRSVDGLAWLGWLGWLHPPPTKHQGAVHLRRPSVRRPPSVLKSAGSAFARSHPRPQLSAGPVERRTPPPMNEEHVHTYICTYPKSCCMVVVVFFLFLPASSLLPTHQTPARSYLLSFFLSSFLPSFLLSVASVASRLVSPIETTDMYGYPAHRTSERANGSDE